MSELEVFAKSIVKTAAKKLSPITFLASQVRQMERADVDQLAVAYLLSQVKVRQRSGVLSVERGAERETPTAEPRWGTQAWDKWAADPRNSEAKDRTLEYRRDLRKIDEKHQHRLFAEFSRSLEIYKAEVRMEWTRELLDSEFALGDGTNVRWGDATKEQHEYRFKMHSQHAVAGMEGAARHKQAIETLETTGANTLREAVAIVAA